LLCRDVFCFRAVSRSGYVNGAEWQHNYDTSVPELVLVLWPPRQVVRRFTVEQMLQYAPDYAEDILYLEPGSEVHLMPAAAPLHVDAAGWCWAVVVHAERAVGASGWIHPGILWRSGS
jgi:hypothetical protein